MWGSDLLFKCLGCLSSWPSVLKAPDFASLNFDLPKLYINCEGIDFFFPGVRVNRELDASKIAGIPPNTSLLLGTWSRRGFAVVSLGTEKLPLAGSFD